jgi:hypothetical protein
MDKTVMVIILVLPWSLLGIMLLGILARRLRKVPVHSR